MHVLVTRSIESFLRDTYGEAFWASSLRSAGLLEENAEIHYRCDEDETRALLIAAGAQLKKPIEHLLEDLGTYLVSHRNSQRVRRLLRFAGETFEDFLHSLDDLPDRTRLAVGDLSLPGLELWEESDGSYRLDIENSLPGFAPTLLGALRAMADDYGALVLMELEEGKIGPFIQISLLDRTFAEGNDFSLSATEMPADASQN